MSELIASYNNSLVILAFFIAVFASYTTLNLAKRVQDNQSLSRKYWLLGGAVVMGIGIWSMHFIAMLAFHLEKMRVSYDIPLTLLSLITAILASRLALGLLTNDKLTKKVLVIGGCIMGVGIASMHYLGMMAIHFQGVLKYDTLLGIFSLLVAITASIIALQLALQLDQNSPFWQKFFSALLMGVAISGMHYTGMMATHFIPVFSLPFQPKNDFDPLMLGIIITLATFLVLGITLITSFFDQKLSDQVIKQELLQASEKQFRTLIKEIPVGILLLDSDGNIIFANNTAMSLFSLTVGIGNIYELVEFYDENRERIAVNSSPIFQAIKNCKSIKNKTLKINKDNNWKCLLGQIDPQINEENKIERVVCTFIDITKEREITTALKASEERFSFAIAGANDGIWDWDLVRNIVYFSPRWKAMLGYEDHELNASFEVFANLIHSDDLPKVEKILDEYLKKERDTYEIEFRGHHKDGTYRWILSRGSAQWDSKGKPLRMSGSHTDITTRKEVEAELNLEKEKSEKLLLNILPASIVESLKNNPQLIAEHYNHATILFADLVNFTPLADKLPPLELVNLLNQIFSEFDHEVENLGLEKIKTIGDAYMVVGGLPIPKEDHIEAIANMALFMRKKIKEFQTPDRQSFQIRIGIHTGEVVAGVIGVKKFIYDLWGDTVNIASRMESHGKADYIQVTDAVYQKLKYDYVFRFRGEIAIKGKGLLPTYWLLDRIK